MYLFFDTETTGLPNNWNAPVLDTKNWPRMVQVAFLLYQSDGTLLESENYIIKPDGFKIPLDVSRMHGITTERAINEGEEIATVLSKFQTMTSKSTTLVAHNIEFDEKIVGCEFYRLTGRDPLSTKQKFCTMKNPSVINYCAIPPIRYGSYKWPKLPELHYKLFGTHFDEAHNASVDIQATARCFFELKKRRVI
ncbi:MAG: 3'-5' exonuclease [Bacteroidetes bacterium]|nr:MAG: 3'-5' exonuclease [Bacteroidota bacterium]